MLPEVYVDVFAELRSREANTMKTTRNGHYPGKITANQKPGIKITVHQLFVDQVNQPTAGGSLEEKKKN